jgi:hypothetical protein
VNDKVHKPIGRRAAAELGRYAALASRHSMTGSREHLRPHRGAKDNPALFARRYVEGRIAGLEKDIGICLTPFESKARRGKTHAYFPALAACSGLLEYLTALGQGNKEGVGWRQVANWALLYMDQPDYDEETVRILFDSFRHAVAHRGIASGIWRDQKPQHSKRLTWKIYANSSRPSCKLVAESGTLTRDPPWECAYTHRMHIHLNSLRKDLVVAAKRYIAAIERSAALQGCFMRCMRQLYPQ